MKIVVNEIRGIKMELSSIEIVVIEVKGVRRVKVLGHGNRRGFKVKTTTLISQILLNTRMSNIQR